MILAVAFALAAMSLCAAPVDADAALAHATSFLSSSSRGGLTAPNATLRLAYVEVSARDAALADFYVFNADGGAGYVLVAGDDRVEAILGYGPGSLDMDRIPENMRWLLDQYKSQIEWLREHPEAHVVPRSQQPDADEPTVEPLPTCLWSQQQPFNDQCAMYEGRRCLTGCVATAMAQVMHYWRYPAELPSVDAYVSETLRIPHDALPPVTLDWDNMLDSYNYGYTEEQGAAVATLMRYCSQACLMDCKPTGSGAREVDQLIAFKMFGYNPGAKLLWRDDYSFSQWNAMIVSELQAGHPIPYCGYSDYGGHAFVLDGCKDGKYHLNWGNSSYDQGYYEMDLLGNTGHEFKYGQSMNYQVYPAQDDGTSSLPAYDFEVDGIYYLKNGDEATVTYRDKRFNSYRGDVVIPSQVEHDGVTYRVTAVGDDAFSSCDSLTSVAMPSIERFGSYVFVGSNHLSEVTFGKKFTCEYGSFCRMTSLERVNVEDLDAWASIDFPIYFTPLYFARHLYSGGSEVKDVVIHSDAKSIGRYAFILCESLENVTIEDGVTRIGKYAFDGCPNLKKVTIGGGEPIIDGFAFEDCSSLVDITFQSVKSIGEYAFYGCKSLKSLDFPASLDSIAFAAFYDCTALESIDFHGSNVKLEEYPFYQCTALISVKLPTHQKTVSYGAFYGCSSLKTVNLGWALEHIAGKAFDSCSSLQEITIPKSVTVIGADAFEGCHGLKRVNAGSVLSWCGIRFGDANANPLSFAKHLYIDGEEVTRLEIPAGVSVINDYSFYACEGLTDLTIGEDVSAVGERSFYKCKNLSEVTVGDGVKSIGKLAFGSCTSLKLVALGRGLESLDSKAFNGGMVINEITSKATTPPVMAAKDCFSNTIYKNAVVSVPLGSLAAYKAAPYWSQFEQMNCVSLCDGDVNRDGEVNIADVNVVINTILRGDGDLSCDVNGDGEVNIADIVAIIYYLLNEG